MVGHVSMYNSVQMYEKGMYKIGSVHDILVDDGLVGVSRKTLEPRQKNGRQICLITPPS